MHQFKDAAINDGFDSLMQSVNDAEVKAMKLVIYRAAVAEMVVTGILKDDAIFAGAEECLNTQRSEIEASGGCPALQDAIREVRVEVREMFRAAKQSL